MNNNIDEINESAVRTLNLEIDGLKNLVSSLKNGLNESFLKATQIIQASTGRIVVTGMGKSGHIGQKVAASLASTGTPAYFVHPSEASHGDLGMITGEDVLLAFSWSGETLELMSVLDYANRFKVPLIAITSNPESALSQAASVSLTLPKSQEACPHGLAPTTSTTMQLALGDAIAIALLEARGFSARDFKVFHPGGKLGANLKLVKDIMHTGDKIPLVKHNTMMGEALIVMSEKGFGCLGVINDHGNMAGIITDGDLRRHMSTELLNMSAEQVMSSTPKTISTDTLASSAIETINSNNITSLFVTEGNKPVGILHIHDLLRVGIA